VAARDKTCGKFFGEGFKTAVARRDTARSH
jgi:hypothetical protein